MKHTYIYVIGFIAAILGAWFFQQSTQLSQPEHALYYQQARDIKPFELIDHNGDPFTKAKLKGKWSLVFFWLYFLS